METIKPNLKIFDQMFVGGVALLAFVIPLFFLPFTFEFYFFNKTLLLYCSTLLFLILWAIRIIKESQIKMTCSPFDLPIFLILISCALSIIFASPNKVEALLGRGGLIISLTILFFVITNNLSTIRYTLYAMITSTSVLALLAIYQYIGVSAELFDLPIWMQSKIWTPAGSPLALLTFLVPVFILSLVFALKNKQSLFLANARNEDSWFKTLLLLTAALQITGIILIGSLVLPGKEFAINLLPYRAGWQIAVSAFGSSPLFGVGPENFLSAFTRFRPVDLNNRQEWTFRYLFSSNEYFQILTTLGILGFCSYLFLLIRYTGTAFKQVNNGSAATPMLLTTPLLTIFLMQIFLPANLLLLFLEYLLLALLVIELKNAGSNNVRQVSLQLPVLRKNSWFLLIPVVIFVSGVYYLTGRAWLASYYFRQSLLAAAENRGKDTYDLQIKAIGLNPYIDRYRVTFSLTNLALANSVAARTDITGQDRQDIAQLIQQAIREAKAATALNRGRVTNWENLAGLYRNLINFAQDADQWATASYIQAIRLDPTNPLLRLGFGGLYYSLENYDDAIRQFQISVELKPDYANGYYNLSAAYREKGEIKKAVDQMTIVTNLVEINSGDYKNAINELEELKKRLPEEEKIESVGQPETLTEPQGLPTPMISPPLELPEEVQPEITPSPEPSPTPSPTSIPSL